MSNIFELRENILPYEYPEFVGFTEAIHNSFWEVSHFNFERDCRDFKIELSEVEQEVIKRAMLAISVVENKVKSFWAKCPERFQKPEIANAGYTFSSNEVVHQLCYQKVLDLLDLSDEFTKVLKIPCMVGRGKYLTKYLSGVNSRSNKEYTKSLILFTLMVENCSLFSQFLIVSSFSKYKNIMKTFSKIITSTSRDEILHGKFGATLVNIIRKENPDWFDSDMEAKIRRNVHKAMKAETEVLNWIFENGELDFISKEEVIEYLKSRFNDSLNLMQYDDEYTLDEELLKKSNYMKLLSEATTSFDFFDGKSSDYVKNKSFEEESIWS